MDGRNWYTYVENNPLAATDPSGLYQVKLHWRNVGSNAYHVFIRVIDNDPFSKTFGQSWAFSGGPQRGGIKALIDPGKVTDYSGWYSRKHFDGDPSDGWVIEQIRRLEFLKKVRAMLPEAGWNYGLLPDGSTSGKNSNTFARMIIDAISLYQRDGGINERGNDVIDDLKKRMRMSFPGWLQWGSGK